MDLKEELARQSLLLQFISECAGIDSVDGMLGAMGSHLRWIADHDAFTVLLADSGDVRTWTMSKGSEIAPIAESELPSSQTALVAEAMRTGAPRLAELGEESGCGIGLHLGGSDHTIGVLLLKRTGAPFSQSDVRHLQHASRAIGAALTRIAGVQTERLAQREVEVAEARLRALAEDRALFAEQMIGIVSHDLRNPLAAIGMGAAALGIGHDLPPQKARVLMSVTSAAHRARRLIDDLLDFTVTRVGEGLQVSREPVDLHELVARSVEELTLAFDGHAIRHRIEGPGQVMADPDRIEQVIGNLVGNAVKYGDADAEIVVVSSVNEGTAMLCVHNQGSAIPDDIRSTLFEPMVRGSVANSRVRSVGLGLFIVRAVARAHGGSVEVVSDSGDGTTFTITFPA